MSSFHEVFAQLSAPVQLSSYQSVFQLAAALNLVLSGYSELRTDIEADIERRTNEAKPQIRQVIRTRTERLGNNKFDKQCTDRLNDALVRESELSSFCKGYYSGRGRWRRTDNALLLLLMFAAVVSIGLLLASSSGLGGSQVDNFPMIGLSLVLMSPVVIAVARVLWLSRLLRETVRKRAVDITGAVTRAYNADVLQLHGLRVRAERALRDYGAPEAEHHQIAAE